jgi:hypothetical protein
MPDKARRFGRLSLLTRLRRAVGRAAPARPRRLPLGLDCLEGRIVPSYTFSLAGQTATVFPVANTGGPLLIDEVMVGGSSLLEWSQDGGQTFSTDWDSGTPGTQTLAANTASSINISPSAGPGSSLTLGDLASPASNIFASIFLGPAFSAANNSLIIDDRSSTHAAGTYDFYSDLGSITGPGGASAGINFSSFGPINTYKLLGGPGANTYNIHSTFNAVTTNTTIVGGAGNDVANVLGNTSPGIGTPLTIDMGGGANTVTAGGGNVQSTIAAPVTVQDTGGTTALTVDDTADTTGPTTTITASTVKVGTAAAISFGTGVTAQGFQGVM